MTEYFDERKFRDALGSFVTGVTLVTTIDAAGEQRGFTANSFTSVSLKPPLIAVCIAHGASCFDAFADAKHFAVNILTQEQKPLSVLFASPVPGRFDTNHWRTGPTGSPVLGDALAWLDCERHAAFEAGDHTILIGRVVALEHQPHNPLAYYRGNYIEFGLSAIALSMRYRLIVGAILDYQGAILFTRDENGRLALPVANSLGTSDEPDSLRGKIHALGVSAELGPLFSVYDGEANSGQRGSLIFYRGELVAPPSDSSAGADAAGEAGAGILINENEIPWDEIVDSAVKSMLRRFVEERRQNRFGVYVGGSEGGRVHSSGGRAGGSGSSDNPAS